MRTKREPVRFRPHPCGMLGNLLDAGRGVPRDLERVRDLWQLACEAGDERACRRIGDPRGAKTQQAASTEKGELEGDRKACARDIPTSCERRAWGMLRSPGEVVDDPRPPSFYFARASTLFGKACERDDAEACLAAGDMRKVGLGLARDVEGAKLAYDKAGRLTEASCANGDGEACERLAWMCANGQAVSSSPERAVAALRRAEAIWSQGCERPGGRAACERLDGLRRKGTVVSASDRR
jgi:TPR repeat protein